MSFSIRIKLIVDPNTCFYFYLRTHLLSVRQKLTFSKSNLKIHRQLAFFFMCFASLEFDRFCVFRNWFQRILSALGLVVKTTTCSWKRRHFHNLFVNKSSFKLFSYEKVTISTNFSWTNPNSHDFFGKKSSFWRLFLENSSFCIFFKKK